MDVVEEYIIATFIEKLQNEHQKFRSYVTTYISDPLDLSDEEEEEEVNTIEQLEKLDKKLNDQEDISKPNSKLTRRDSLLVKQNHPTKKEETIAEHIQPKTIQAQQAPAENEVIQPFHHSISRPNSFVKPETSSPPVIEPKVNNPVATTNIEPKQDVHTPINEKYSFQ